MLSSAGIYNFTPTLLPHTIFHEASYMYLAMYITSASRNANGS